MNFHCLILLKQDFLQKTILLQKQYYQLAISICYSQNLHQNTNPMYFIPSLKCHNLLLSKKKEPYNKEIQYTFLLSDLVLIPVCIELKLVDYLELKEGCLLLAFLQLYLLLSQQHLLLLILFNLWRNSFQLKDKLYHSRHLLLFILMLSIINAR